MNYTVEQEHKAKMLNTLIESPLVNYEDLLNLTNAFQIASGQSYSKYYRPTHLTLGQGNAAKRWLGY